MDQFITICKKFKIPPPIPEYQFVKDRKWRIDYAWPDVKFACELEGGAYINGRHNRASGFLKDIEKYDRLTEEGWILLRYTPRNIDYEQIKRVYDGCMSKKIKKIDTT